MSLNFYMPRTYYNDLIRCFSYSNILDDNIHNVYENLLGRVGLASDCLHRQAILGLTSSVEFFVFPLHSFFFNWTLLNLCPLHRPGLPTFHITGLPHHSTLNAVSAVLASVVRYFPFCTCLQWCSHHLDTFSWVQS